MRLHKKILFILTLCMLTCNIYAKTIIWDLGGVIFKPQKHKIALFELGLPSLLRYTFLDGQNPVRLQNRTFEILNLLGTQKGPDHLKLKSINGLELPQIFVDVQTGSIAPGDALEQVNDLIELLYSEGLVSSFCEKNILHNIMRTMFDSDTFITYMQPMPGGIRLMAECAQNFGCEQYILSNWDACSFELLYKLPKGQRVFQHVPPQNIMISGECGLAKPDPAIFKHFIATYGLDPKECIFIDDNLDNIKSAYECGLNAIWFHNMSYSYLRKLLIKHGFLNPSANTSLHKLKI